MKIENKNLIGFLFVFSIAVFQNQSLIAKSIDIPLQAKSASKVSGVLKIEPIENGIFISGKIMGLAPGFHGFHVHEKGDCSAEDASSAGGHFTIDHEVHGSAHSEHSHLGDLGNIVANADGIAEIHLKSERLCLDPKKPCNILNRSLVVHADPDDLKSQPSGNSGKRVACGVIAQK